MAAPVFNVPIVLMFHPPPVMGQPPQGGSDSASARGILYPLPPTFIYGKKWWGGGDGKKAQSNIVRGWKCARSW